MKYLGFAVVEMQEFRRFEARIMQFLSFPLLMKLRDVCTNEVHFLVTVGCGLGFWVWCIESRCMRCVRSVMLEPNISETFYGSSYM